MILVPSRNLYLPERFKSKKRQRGSIIIATQGASSIIGDPGLTVTLSGEIHNDPGESGIEVGIRFNSDGTVDSLLDTTYTQIDTTTDWLAAADRGSAPGLYEVMTDNWADIGGDPSGFENSAASVYGP